MKVQHIISESELKEWNPKDALMKKFGSKTAATKMDIDAETKAITKDFEAYYKNTPDGTPTTDLLFSFLKKKGLPITSPKDILAVPVIPNFFISGWVKCNPAVGAAIAPGLVA